MLHIWKGGFNGFDFLRLPIIKGWDDSLDHPHLLRCLPWSARLRRTHEKGALVISVGTFASSSARPSLTSMSSFQRIESAPKTTFIPLPQVVSDRTEPNTMGMALLGKESTLPPPSRRPTPPSTFTCAGKKVPGNKLLLYRVSWCWCRKSWITIKIAGRLQLHCPE